MTVQTRKIELPFWRVQTLDVPLRRAFGTMPGSALPSDLRCMLEAMGSEAGRR